MGAPPPAFTIRHPDYGMSDHVTPFHDYDCLGPQWHPETEGEGEGEGVGAVVEEWTTNERITFEQLEAYGGYYVGERSDMYAVSHLAYHVEGHYMPVFRKITGYDVVTDCRWLRIMRKQGNNTRRGYHAAPPPAVFARPAAAVNSSSSSSSSPTCLNCLCHLQAGNPKRLDILINVQGLRMIPTPTPNPNPNPNPSQPPPPNGYGEDQELQVEEDEEQEEDEEEEEEVCCFMDEIIEDYFSDNASSSESPVFGHK